MNPTQTTYKISDFLQWQRGKQLELSPWFQRRSVWPIGARSYLIDTIIRGFPTPPIFLRDLPSNLKTLESRREVVDGQQRLRTVFAFIDIASLHGDDTEEDAFSISKAHNKDLAGLEFEYLDKVIRRQILDYKFPVTIFPADTDERSILEVFARMNATGVALNAQELRNARYYGEFKSMAYALAAEYLEFWIEKEIFRPHQIARMKEVELVSDLLILIINGVTAKTKATVDSFYRDYESDLDERAEIERRFRAVMKSIGRIGDEAFEGLYSKTTLFYALFGAIYDAQWGLGSSLTRSKSSAISDEFLDLLCIRGREIDEGDVSARVQEAATTRTSHASNRNILIKYLLD